MPLSLGSSPSKNHRYDGMTEAGTTAAYVLAVVAAVNAVIAFGYYGRLALRMWVEEPYLGDKAPIRVPAALVAALVITTGCTIAFGVYPGWVTHFTDVSLIALGN